MSAFRLRSMPGFLWPLLSLEAAAAQVQPATTLRLLPVVDDPGAEAWTWSDGIGGTCPGSLATVIATKL